MNLKQALNNPLYKTHKKDDVYKMDGIGKWKLVYYPIFECGKTKEIYNEPRALMQDITKKGFWSKEVPLRYLERI